MDGLRILRSWSQCPALFAYSEDEDIKVMMGRHVGESLDKKSVLPARDSAYWSKVSGHRHH